MLVVLHFSPLTFGALILKQIHVDRPEKKDALQPQV